MFSTRQYRTEAAKFRDRAEQADRPAEKAEFHAGRKIHGVCQLGTAVPSKPIRRRRDYLDPKLSSCAIRAIAYLDSQVGVALGVMGPVPPQCQPRQTASMSSIFLGHAAVRTSWPVAVTTTSSSIRIPMPRSSGGTSAASLAT